MRFSIYPTDTSEVIEDVLDLAGNGGDRLVFTSLHIPESENLKKYLDFLKAQVAHGFTFFADISPLALERLSLSYNTISTLEKYGIVGLRLDFGFSLDEIRQIAKSGIPIAVNASTVDEQLIDALKTCNLVGWHNYYPRPETGLGEVYFLRQSALFTERGLPLYGFIPGEKNFRAPLYKGLPMLESQRYKNAYRNFLEIQHLCPKCEIFCAEGAVHKDHFEWIRLFEMENVLTLPLSYIDNVLAPKLLNHVFTIRKEETDFSVRLEGTREAINAEKFLQGECRAYGSVQMDTALFARYQGEIHIMTRDVCLTDAQTRVAEIAEPYKKLVDFITGGSKIRFVV